MEATQQISGKDAWYPTGQKDIFILRQLVTKDFKLKYRRSALGILWSVLNPLLMMIVLAAVFGSFMNNRAPEIGNFPVYLILGNTAWQLMADATSQGMGSIIGAAPLLKKVKVNRYVFPVQKALFAGVNYAFSIMAIALVMLFEGVPVGPTALLWPVWLLMLIAFSSGLSLLLSALSVFFRDVMHLWGVVLTAWMYLTPIFYSVTLLPDWLHRLEVFNPMYCYVTYLRQIVLFQSVPSPQMHLACIAYALGSLLLGYVVFRRHEHKFILFI
ncbi:ABC transporter permease [Olsenella massiliensis]|uniref:ABC transporter permease n=1 Tax=Olsenella massiliensis TaxID=1622075 RepID=UPI000AB8A84D|nr:ABC transporter permease [Olsenella massiliensis]